MENEIELKIMLADENIELVKNWLSKQNVISQAVDVLGNTYFDTPDQFFAVQQMGLRVRTKNNHYEMTLKAKGEIVGGLHIRPEYNLPLDSNQPDFKRLNSHFNLQMANAEQIAENLVPTFSTDFTRTTWLLECNGSQIEAGLDLGLIKNPFGEEKICELEFELKSGELADIFTLLETMPKRDGMWLSNLSKAQRGYLVGQAVKFAQKIAKALQTKTGDELEQQLADYIRIAPENAQMLAKFNQLNHSAFNWEQAKQYLTSKAYLIKNLERLRLFMQK